MEKIELHRHDGITLISWFDNGVLRVVSKEDGSTRWYYENGIEVSSSMRRELNKIEAKQP